MSQLAFYFDSTRCTGCRTCEIACKDYWDLGDDIAYRHIYDYEEGTWDVEGDVVIPTVIAYHASVACNHCDDPACIRACPTGAMHKNPDNGVVSVNPDVCIGCGYCHMACPYNAPKVDRARGHSVKCDFCQDRVAEGKNPICVDACPLRALAFGPVEEISQLGPRADFEPLPPVECTGPNLYVKECHSAIGSGSSVGSVVNPKEVM